MAVVTPTVQQHNNRQSPEPPVRSEISSISTPQMTISNVDMWETFSDVGNFYSNDEPRKGVLLSNPSPPQKQEEKEKLAKGCLFSNEGEYRSMSAKSAGNCCQKKRTNPDRLGIKRDSANTEPHVLFSN